MKKWQFTTMKEQLKTILSVISVFATPKQYIEVFQAFQKNDWRHNSCGGCI